MARMGFHPARLGIGRQLEATDPRLVLWLSFHDCEIHLFHLAAFEEASADERYKGKDARVVYKWLNESS